MPLIKKRFSVRVPITPKPKASVRVHKKGVYNPSQKRMSLLKKWMVEYLQANNMTMPVFPEGKPLLVIIHYRMPVTKNRRKEQIKA